MDTQIQLYNLLVGLITERKHRFPKTNKIDLFIGLIECYKIKNATQASYAIRRMAQHHLVDIIDRIY
jgi:hypothetical protein